MHHKLWMVCVFILGLVFQLVPQIERNVFNWVCSLVGYLDGWCGMELGSVWWDKLSFL